MDLTLKKARSILKEGKKEHSEEYPPVYEGEIPDDEAKMISDAEELVQMAEEAKEGGQDHPAIDKILFLAEVDGGSESDPNSSEEPWEDYDTDKVGAILKKLPELSADELAAVFEYERENKNRDTLVAALEELAEEIDGEDDEESEEEDEDEDYVPWSGYDDDPLKSVLKKIAGMELDGVSSERQKEFFQNIKDYEEEREDRSAVTSLLDSLIEEVEEEETDDDAEESSEDESDELTREALEEMEKDELREVIKINDLSMRVTEKITVEALRVKIAEALSLEWAEDEDSEETEEEESDEGFKGLDWETLEQLELDELKDVIQENDLGFRAGPKSDLDSLREKIANALEIKMPAAEPWRGYDKRKLDQIKKKLPKLDDEELAAVYEYESENKNRAGLMKELEKIASERGLSSEEADEEESEEDEGSTGSKGTDAGSESEGEAAEEGEEGEPDEAEPDEEAGGDDDRHLNLISHITERVEEEHLSVPARPPQEVMELPFDLTELDDKELRQTYSAFLSYFGRAAFISKVEKQLANACKNIADDKFNEILSGLDKLDPETEKEKTATQLKAEAESSPKVSKWRKRERGHRAVHEAMRDDCSIYSQNIESLSREWTMRHEEIEHSGGLTSRKARKGK